MKSVLDVRASKRYDTSMDRNGKRMIQNDHVQEAAFVNIEKITQGKNLTDTEQTVLEYILDHLDTVQTEGVRGVARANYTSTSTIMRLARKMDYSGFVDMCYKLRSFTETPHQTMKEEENFLNSFGVESLLNYNTYTQLKACAEKILEQKDKIIFVYGTGFSGTVCTYLTQKLVNMGILCVSATGGDSVGIFENTLERMGMFFCISKSGETSMVRDKIKTAQENGVCTVAITGEQKNSIGQFADLWFRVENPWKLDDQNTMPNTFFPQTMMLIELIAYEYRRLCLEKDMK